MSEILSDRFPAGSRATIPVLLLCLLTLLSVPAAAQDRADSTRPNSPTIEPVPFEIPEEYFGEAPVQAAGSYTINDVIVEGTESTSAAAVVAFSGIRIGDRIQQGSDLFSRAIRNLHQRKIFRDVEIYAREAAPGKVDVIISVLEFPRIGSIDVDGNDEIDDDDLLEVADLRTGDIADPYRINLAERQMQQKYEEEGYLFSEIDSRLGEIRDTIGRVGISFLVREGPEVKIGSIAIDGNSRLSDDDVKDAMQGVREKSWYQFWRSSKLDRSKLEADLERIVDLYRSEGFIEARIEKDTVVIDRATGKSDITITVDEGPRTYLRRLVISGNEVYDENVIRRLIDVPTGEPYDQHALEENLLGNADQSVRSWYLNNGYLTFNAEITEQRVGSDSIDAYVTVVEGEPAYIRYVDIAGNTKTRDEVIRRELFTVPGERFSRARLIRSLRNLANLNYFNPEALVPDVRPSADATSVDIVYDVEERPSDTFNASLGLSSQGITGSIGLSFTNFSLSEPFFGGGGQILNLNAEFGSFVQTYSLGVTEPWLFGKPITLGGNAFYQKTELVTTSASDYKNERFGATMTSGTRLNWPDDFFRLDGALRFTRNNLLGTDVSRTGYRNGSELSLSASLSRASTDDPIFPTLGSRFRLAALWAFALDAQYLRPEVSFEFFSPIARTSPRNTFVLRLASEFGYLDEHSDRSSISPTVYYVMGGTGLSGYNTVPLRGYDDRAIGPYESGFPIGRTNLKLTAEIRYPLTLNPIPVYFLTFAEAGNVWGGIDEFNPFDLKRSIGLGMRVMMPPIGLIGFDYGFGFDADTRSESPLIDPASSGWKFHFQFGR